MPNITTNDAITYTNKMVTDSKANKVRKSEKNKKTLLKKIVQYTVFIFLFMKKVIGRTIPCSYLNNKWLPCCSASVQ